MAVLAYIAWLIFVGVWVIAAVLTVRTTRRVIDLERRDPAVFKAAGFRGIDWMPRFYAGLFRLAYGKAGESLSAEERALYRATAIAVVVGVAVGLALLTTV